MSMKLFVTFIEIDSSVYAEVDLSEKTAEEIRAWHVAKYMASGLWEESDVSDMTCSATTVEAAASFWKNDDVHTLTAGASSKTASMRLDASAREEVSDNPTRVAVITMKVHLAEGGHCRLLGHSRDWNSVLGLEGDLGEYVEWHSHILDAGDEHLVEGFKNQVVWWDGRAFGRNEGVYIAPDSSYGKGKNDQD